MTGQSHTIGQVVGGPAVGLIGTAFSLRAAIVSTGLLVAPVAALYARARKYIPAPGVTQSADLPTAESAIGEPADVVEE